MNELLALLILILFTLIRVVLPLLIVMAVAHVLNLASDRRAARLSGA